MDRVVGGGQRRWTGGEGARSRREGQRGSARAGVAAPRLQHRLSARQAAPTLKSEVEISVRKLSADIWAGQKIASGADHSRVLLRSASCSLVSDTLGQDTKTAGLRKRNHSTEKPATLVVLVEEAPVDFYDVARQPPKVTEIGVASAKIIDPQFDTKILQAESAFLNGVRPFGASKPSVNSRMRSLRAQGRYRAERAVTVVTREGWLKLSGERLTLICTGSGQAVASRKREARPTPSTDR